MADSDLTLVTGTTLAFSSVWEQQNDAGAFEPVIITGCTARFVMRDENTGETLVTASTGAGITLNGDTGEVVVNLPPSKTAGLRGAMLGDVGYELRVTFPSGDVYSLMMGFVAIVEGKFND
ncbi:hypothetical protein [Enterovibrio norvegicus]|uniref:hypothetical protein n=1 Tax=Enterovibrio norvegicus TaxID=188144 RepID=UPI000C81DA96|nr:hypothetical protein [Enterovibrio norvegicus]PMN73151.1 hypothetical protein BCT27_12465 [Enterovibrio norvegicus]